MPQLTQLQKQPEQKILQKQKNKQNEKATTSMSRTRFIKLNPLSTPKHAETKYRCELCGLPSKLACKQCRVTTYCDEEHLKQDWDGIHDKICPLLGALRSLRPTLGSEDERERRNLTVNMSHHALIELCRNESMKHMVHRRYLLAIPGALQSLRFSLEVYGQGALQLVPAYLLLAEANLGLRRFRIAEEFLLYANWAILKSDHAGQELMALLHRNFGKLYAAQRRYDDAIQQLALDAYYSSLNSGPENIDTAVSYYLMAEVFLKNGSMDNGFAFFDKCIEIWQLFFVNLKNRENESISDYLSESQIGNAVEMLKSILRVRRQHFGDFHVVTGEAAYTFALLKHLTGFDVDAKKLYAYALFVYSGDTSDDCKNMCDTIRATLQEIPDGASILDFSIGQLEAYCCDVFDEIGNAEDSDTHSLYNSRSSSAVSAISNRQKSNSEVNHFASDLPLSKSQTEIYLEDTAVNLHAPSEIYHEQHQSNSFDSEKTAGTESFVDTSLSHTASPERENCMTPVPDNIVSEGITPFISSTIDLPRTNLNDDPDIYKPLIVSVQVDDQEKNLSENSDSELTVTIVANQSIAINDFVEENVKSEGAGHFDNDGDLKSDFENTSIDSSSINTVISGDEYSTPNTERSIMAF